MIIAACRESTFGCCSVIDLDCGFLKQCDFYYNCCRSCNSGFFFFDVEGFEQAAHAVLAVCVTANVSESTSVLYVLQAAARVKVIESGSDHFAADHPSPYADWRRSHLFAVEDFYGRMKVGLDEQRSAMMDGLVDWS